MRRWSARRRHSRSPPRWCADGAGALAVAGDPRQAARGGPAAVAIHDDGDMRGRRPATVAASRSDGCGGHRSDQTWRMSFSLSASTSSTRLMYWSVSFCTSILPVLCDVLADLVLLLVRLDLLHAVAPDRAHRDLGALGVFVRRLHQFGAPLGGELRDRHADQLPVGRRDSGPGRNRESPSRPRRPGCDPRPAPSACAVPARRLCRTGSAASPSRRPAPSPAPAGRDAPDRCAAR